jgi:hypothetical protein
MPALNDPAEIRAFQAWLVKAKPGAVYVYHTAPAMQPWDPELIVTPRDLFAAVRLAGVKGAVFIAQVREPKQNVYTAQRCRKDTLRRIEQIGRRA